MYVVIRQTDVGSFEILAVFKTEYQADQLAELANVHDNGPDWEKNNHNAYISFVEFTPVSVNPRKTFRDIFDTEPPAIRPDPL